MGGRLPKNIRSMGTEIVYCASCQTRLGNSDFQKGRVAWAENRAYCIKCAPEGATKVLFLLTDGDDHEGGAVELAREALAEHGIKTFTVGVGDATRSAGAQVPGAIEGRTQPMVHQGQIVFSKLDVQGLRDIALAGDGQYASLGDFHHLVEAIAKMWQSDLATEERQQFKPQYQWFVAAALLLLGLEALFGDPKVAMGQGVSRVWQQEVQA